jgi:hypothetical protein
MKCSNQPPSERLLSGRNCVLVPGPVPGSFRLLGKIEPSEGEGRMFGIGTSWDRLIDALMALGGASPKKRAISSAVRQCVEKLNELDERYDGFIETGERKALCAEIDEIVYAAGLRNCDGMADKWREW